MLRPLHGAAPGGGSARGIRRACARRSRKAPSIALVMANEFCFSTPRIAMHRCVASMTTRRRAAGSSRGCVSAIWFVSRSCTCSRRAKMSTSRGILLRPITLPLRDVGDVALAEERQQVMLAQAVEVDVLDDHHLVIIDGEQRVVEHGVDVGRVAARQEPQRLLRRASACRPALSRTDPLPARPGAAG